MRKRQFLPQGAEVVEGGVRYRVWAPERAIVEVEICDGSGHAVRSVPLVRDFLGDHHGLDPRGRAGDLYRYRIDRKGTFPCPASRWQPLGVHGPSMVIDPTAFRWNDPTWRRPEFRDLVIYELHVGTFTPEGTFLGAISRLDHLRALGVNTIELMPIGDFDGERNWGYDGVQLFAPSRAYGHPDDLRKLVEAAHARGIAVILDVVYNHFGPAGNYLREFTNSYFDHARRTPWGEPINFSGEHFGPVRAYFVANVIYWMEEFHIDGFRLDATHAIFDASPKDILEELGEAVHARGGWIIAEDERNDARLISSKRDGGCNLDGVWADDFHHSIEAAITDASSYRDVFEGELRELVDLMQHGWHYRGKTYRRSGKPRGTPCEHLPPERFVFCISNHDQVGNRPLGERLNQLVAPETYRAASALLCLTPFTPLLFMGQEWAASAPFLYFTDHEGELGRAIEEGRRRDLERSIETARLRGPVEIPSPQDAHTFERSKIDWSETTKPGHAECLALYRECLALRRTHAAFRPRNRQSWQVCELGFGVLATRLRAAGEDWLVLCDLRGGHRGSLGAERFCELPASQKWAFVLSTSESRFGGAGSHAFTGQTDELNFAGPELVVCKSSAS